MSQADVVADAPVEKVPLAEAARAGSGGSGGGPRSDVPDYSRLVNVFMVVVMAVAAVLFLALLFVNLTPMAVGLAVITLMICLLLMGVDIAIAMLGVAAIGLWKFRGVSAVETTMQDTVFHAVANWNMNVVPLFVLMGFLLWKSGVTSLVYTAARNWMGGVPGGLAIGTNVAGAGLASASGSTIGISYALGRIAVPEMLKAGYKPSLAAGVVCMAGTLGQMIPPSIILVLYASMAQTPVGSQLMAGLVPGLLLALAYIATIVVISMVRKDIAPRIDTSRIPRSEKLRSLLGLVPITLVVLVVVGGMFAGVFTASESAAFGVLTSAVIAPVFNKELRNPVRYAKFVGGCVMSTIGAVSGLFLLLAASIVLTRVLAMSRIADEFANLVVQMDLNRIEFLLILIVVYIVLGMFVETLPMMLITYPVFAVPMVELGVDPIWFGIFFVLMAEIGMVFPPIGMLVFIIHNMLQDKEVNLGTRISLVDVFKGCLPFVGTAILFAVFLILAPDVVTWLPERMSG